jgi:hypothetical protein
MNFDTPIHPSILSPSATHSLTHASTSGFQCFLLGTDFNAFYAVQARSRVGIMRSPKSPAAASRTNLTQIRLELVHFHFLFRARKNRDYGEWRKYKDIIRPRRLSSKTAVSKRLSTWLLIKACKWNENITGHSRIPGPKDDISWECHVTKYNRNNTMCSLLCFPLL